MRFFAKVSNKLLVLWFASIALSLILAGFLFATLIESHYGDTARDQIHNAFAVLQRDLDLRKNFVSRTSSVVAKRAEVIASVNLVDAYQDLDDYQPLIFDAEKRALAAELAKQIRPGEVDVAALYDSKDRLISFAHARGIDLVRSGYVTYQEGQPVVMVDDGGSHIFMRIFDEPFLVADLNPSMEGEAVFRSTGDGLVTEASAPLLRTFPDGRSARVGHLVMATLISDSFAASMSMRTRTPFSFSADADSWIGGLGNPSGNRQKIIEQIGEAGGRLPAAASLPNPAWFLGGASLPLAQGGEAIFFFGLSKDSIDPNVAAFRTAALAVLLFTGLLVIPSGVFFINRTISVPVTRLVEGVEAVRQGRYGTLDGFDQQDELGSLARSFNGMAATIKSREEELRKLSRAVEGSPASVVITDTRGIIEYVNRKFSEITGYAADEVIGKNSALLRADGTRAGLYPRMWNVVLAGREWRGELRQRTKDGRLFWVWASLSALAGPDGKPSHVVAIAEDVTARKEAEEELQLLRGQLEDLVRQRTRELSDEVAEHERTGEDLRRSKERLRLVVENVVDAIVTYGEDGLIESFNPAAEDVFGYPGDAVVGRRVTMLLGDDGDGPLPEVLSAPGRDTETQGRRRDGTVFPMDMAVSQLTQEGRLAFICIVRDITQRKRYEVDLMAAKAQAEAANEAKSRFLSSMSHELRTPMNAILGFGQLLAANGRDPLSDKQGEYVSYILKSGRHLLELINEVLDLAKIESGNVSLSMEPIDAAKVAAECVSMIEPLAGRRNIMIEETVTSANLPRFRGDLTRVKQVLMNLLSNAIKYNTVGGRVTLSGSMTPDGLVCLAVTDTGLGIPAERMGELFEPFNRLGVELTEIEGTGIGLTISRQLMERMGGSIGVDTELGRGSTFRLHFPVAVIDSQQMALEVEKRFEPASIRAGGYTILYVEDNPSNLRLMDEIIAHIPNARLLSAHNAELGLELARAHKPDVVLMDINLPGMDGYAALRHLRAGAETSDIPVLALSANALPKDIEKGLKAGFRSYMTKPIDIAAMMQAIEAALVRTT